MARFVAYKPRSAVLAVDTSAEITNIDDPFNPPPTNTLLTNDGLWTTYNGNENTNVALSVNFDLPIFRTPPGVGDGPLTRGTNDQRFRLWLRRARSVDNVPATGGQTVNFTIGLRVEGSNTNITTSAVQTLTSATGQYFELLWSATNAPEIDPSGTNVVCNITQTNGGVSTNPNGRRIIQFGAIEWYASFNDLVPYPPSTTVLFF